MQKALGYVVARMAGNYEAARLACMLQDPVATSRADLVPTIVAKELHNVTDLHP